MNPANRPAVRSRPAAAACAAAVFECRVIVSRACPGPAGLRLDEELHALELYYHQRADELTKPPKKRTR